MIKINKDFILGAVFGFGAGYATKSIKMDENSPFRGIIKKGLHLAANGMEKLQENAYALKETFEDLSAEVKSERTKEVPAESNKGEAQATDAKSPEAVHGA